MGVFPSSDKRILVGIECENHQTIETLITLTNYAFFFFHTDCIGLVFWLVNIACELWDCVLPLGELFVGNGPSSFVGAACMLCNEWIS